ncbi:hypothetical protein WICMUC_004914 [Wickerhamomyces mucosus]|uniref:Ribosomal protein/NADH dehydrogenase domain-containing protein n=1 Tax=Wickerhamomyces mucosus TaxID=1378264 RepID=A0A9P8T8X4_9ASCO|nr:hypothetical protein WICMUC_004914 [Wickerhamomyces mucosus]
MFKSLPKSKLSRHVDRLNLLSSGPGSVKVSANVKSIELIFKQRTPKGHMGPRRFWRENLPRIQFHNPALPIQVVRVEPTTPEEAQKIPALLKTRSAKIKYLLNSDILTKFIKLTDATPAQEIIHSPN